jgi:hypothetical protein
MIELIQTRQPSFKNKCVIFSLAGSGEHDRIRQIFISSIIDGPMIHNEYFASQNFSDFQNNNVCIIAKKSDFELADSADVVWSGSEYHLINTHMALLKAWKMPAYSNITKAYDLDRSRPEIELKFAKFNQDQIIKQKYDLEIFTKGIISKSKE